MGLFCLRVVLSAKHLVSNKGHNINMHDSSVLLDF